MRTTLYIGKFRPFHEGHLAIVQTLLMQGDRVVIGIKRQISNEELNELKKLINNIFPKEKIEIIEMGWFDRIAHGRGTNYTFEYIDVPNVLKKVSSTKIRKETGWK